jgi:RNase P subunit RPR2
MVKNPKYPYYYSVKAIMKYYGSYWGELRVRVHCRNCKKIHRVDAGTVIHCVCGEDIRVPIRDSIPEQEGNVGKIEWVNDES